MEFPSASPEDFERLKRLVKKAETSNAPGPKLPELTIVKDDDFSNIAHAVVTKEPLHFATPVHLHLALCPEIELSKWQMEELLRLAGHLDGNPFSPSVKITDQAPYKEVLSAANGSGKDLIIIATFAVWFVLTGIRNRVIITSSSFDQTKYQTEPHIKELIKRVNSTFGKLFHSNQFHHIIPEFGSEIKLFATDEAGKAEGYHPFPYPGARMAIIVNEAKSIDPDIFAALKRCTGYSYWLLISSPGRKSGHMYESAIKADLYPKPLTPGTFFLRYVTAHDCPWIPKSHIESSIEELGIDHPWIQSSIFAQFSDFNEPVCIPELEFNKCFFNPPQEIGDDIGIGLDLAAGGDETGVIIRKGNRVVAHHFFRQADTMVAAAIIDEFLSPYKYTNYIFNADNGGVGKGPIDRLEEFGWRVTRRNNQSPAFNKAAFLNLGAEMWHHMRRLVQNGSIIIPKMEKLKEQLITRQWRQADSTQGKFALQSKKEAKSLGLHSPDRADTFVLCFFSYRPNRPRTTLVKPNSRVLVSNAELLSLFNNQRRGMFHAKQEVQTGQRFTLLNGKI